MFTALEQHKSGIDKLTLFESIHKNTLFVGEVKSTNSDLADRLEMPRDTSRTSLLGVFAAREAIGNLTFDFKRYRPAFISATTVGGMDKTEDYMIQKLRGTGGRLRDVLQHECSKSTEVIARETRMTDHISTINTACSSSVNSIILGSRLIEQGMADLVLAGGTDPLCRFTINGFNSLMILDNEPCRPFDEDRKGLNLGEGAGYVLLASEKVIRENNLSALCRVSGYANTTDAFHQTASSPEGRGSYDAMTHALSVAQLKNTEIDYINLHGTGTMNNDLSEGTAIRKLFGENQPYLSSTKAFTGHTLGACGGIEAIFSVLAIQHQCVFPNLRFKNPIAQIGITPVTTFTKNVPIKNVMSNSFGFGGNCSSIIFSNQ